MKSFIALLLFIIIMPIWLPFLIIRMGWAVAENIHDEIFWALIESDLGIDVERGENE